MSTDVEWEKWGRQDPYFGVITWDRFRADKIDDTARAEFFASGQRHVDSVLGSCRQYVDPQFTPARVLDFGCGVGRLVVPFAGVAAEVVGVDVSPSMLAEARRNCDERGIANVALELSDDQLSRVQGDFDLVHSVIVLQHIEPVRGRLIFKRLVELVRPGGIGALHLTYGKAFFPDSFGQPPAPPPPPAPEPPAAPPPPPSLLRRLLARPQAPPPVPAVVAPAAEEPAVPRDPQMLMNPYNLSEIAFLLQGAGVAKFDAEFTDHGGELGVFLFFCRL